MFGAVLSAYAMIFLDSYLDSFPKFFTDNPRHSIFFSNDLIITFTFPVVPDTSDLFLAAVKDINASIFLISDNGGNAIFVKSIAILSSKLKARQFIQDGVIASATGIHLKNQLHSRSFMFIDQILLQF
ncbi:MAG: hypothetical protein BGO41_04825 [Clostridiales bacterium 38-18]|nr:MAG: hypothetical protein BGO41_04825 [Clostridiales bacterium 38-18]